MSRLHRVWLWGLSPQRLVFRGINTVAAEDPGVMTFCAAIWSLDGALLRVAVCASIADLPAFRYSCWFFSVPRLQLLDSVLCRRCSR